MAFIRFVFVSMNLVSVMKICYFIYAIIYFQVNFALR